jgi:F0F1-type ATP synthase assembly protein I
MARTPDRNDGWSGVSAGWTVTSEMIAALLMWGGIGYVIDRLIWGEPRVFTPVGMMLGAALGIYLVWLRFGKQREQSD